MKNEREVYFLGVLNTLIERGNLAYKLYIKNGQKFLHAKILKENNEAIKKLLIKNTHVLPRIYHPDALALLHHIDVWGAIWNDVAEKEKPKANDFFSFENSVNFPRLEFERLKSHHKSLGS